MQQKEISYPEVGHLEHQDIDTKHFFDDPGKTVIIDMELSRLQMDIVAPQETRLPDSGSVKEINFTFFWQVKSPDETSEQGMQMEAKEFCHYIRTHQWVR